MNSKKMWRNVRHTTFLPLQKNAWHGKIQRHYPNLPYTYLFWRYMTWRRGTNIFYIKVHYIFQVIWKASSQIKYLTATTLSWNRFFYYDKTGYGNCHFNFCCNRRNAFRSMLYVLLLIYQNLYLQKTCKIDKALYFWCCLKMWPNDLKITYLKDNSFKCFFF